MKIVADENIPRVGQYFAGLGELILKPGRMLTREDVFDADMLLIRSVTKIDKELLHDTSVKFVGSVSTGLDHINTEWLDQAGIAWSAAQGCNSVAVVEYVVCVIAALQKQNFLNYKSLRAGVVGVGNIGSKVVEVLKILGFDVIQCDPLRAENEKNFSSTALENFSDLDLITLHVPLIRKGKYPTHHMIDKKFLERQKKDCVLLNTSRGSVINSVDLKYYGQKLIWCLDVWENEPFIDLEVLAPAVIATPHIAGHSVQAKYRGVEMVYRTALQKNIIPVLATTELNYPRKIFSFENKSIDWRDVVLNIYDPAKTTAQMKITLVDDANAFDLLRENFAVRHEFEFVKISDVILNEQDEIILRKLNLY